MIRPYLLKKVFWYNGITSLIRRRETVDEIIKAMLATEI
jgi:hypothetical protein